MPKKQVNRGEDYLAGLDAIKLVLDNGEQVVLDAREETGVPEDLDDIWTAQRNASAKYAFWAYQTERALAAVRLAEIRLSEAEGEKYTAFRVALRSRDAWTGEASIKAEVDADVDIVAQRKALNDLRFSYGTLRSVRDAVANRSQVLITLLGQAKANATAAAFGHKATGTGH